MRLKMAEYDQEEAFYYWVLSDVCSLIRRYGYTKVLTDIDKALKNEDLEVELLSNFKDDEL
jgi:hypothetical protein